MITRVRLLKNIGKFYNFSVQANALDWHKNTFVYAPNAYGKTTLVNVLRSLRDNDPKLIRARKTLGASTDPEAVIMIDGKNYCFKGVKWDLQYSAIQIFDAPFIHANIYTHEIGYEHKKNIHRIIIGAQGIKLAEELTDLKTKEKLKNQELTNLTALFNRAGFDFSMDLFLAIPLADEAAVGARIQKLEQDIKFKESEAVVQVLGFPRQISAPSFELSIAKTLATNKLIATHDAAEKQVLAHIDHNFNDKTQAKQFIRQGLGLMQADCPFCGQNLKNAAELLKVYQECFDEAFQTFQRDVAKQVALLEKWNLDSDITTLGSTQNANIATLRQWEPYLGPIVLPDVATTVEKCRAVLVEMKSQILLQLEKKQKDPNSDADVSQFNTLSAELSKLKVVVEGYNMAVVAFTEKTKQYVSNLPKSDVNSIRVALAKEQQIQSRFAPEWKKWATDYPVVKKHASDLLSKKNAKQNELEAYSKSIFDTYQKRINQLLVTLGTDFTITGLIGKTDERAKESYSDFGFLILQQTVPLSAHQDDVPCFKNTLSEGDKSTLAFALFIAVLESELELDKQIVVFDDPLSSLDETRREATARLLLALSPTVNQLNVFTHKRDFLYMLCDKIPNSKVLQIRSDVTNGSQLELFNVDEARKSDYARLVEDMERYVIEDFGPTTDTMQGGLRKLFEVVLKTKYYRVLVADIKAKHGLATILKTLFSAGLLADDLKSRLFDLCSVTSGAHHGDIVDMVPKKLSRDELVPLIRDALDLIYKV